MVSWGDEPCLHRLRSNAVIDMLEGVPRVLREKSLIIEGSGEASRRPRGATSGGLNQVIAFSL